MIAFVRRTASWIPAAVIGLLALPMAVTNRSFGSDWTLHLWLLRQQQWNIRAMSYPGLFVSVRRLGAFYPIFAFVGSGIYTVGGYLAIALGDRPILAYKLLYGVGLCTAFGGMTWLSAQRGLRGWRAQAAGIVFVTEAYFVTDLAGRGDLGEFVGLASIPLLLAATYAVLTAPRPRAGHRFALIAAAFLFTGSHNITLLWGSLFLVLLALALLLSYGRRAASPLPLGRIGIAIGCAAIGAGLNAWYLFADIAYGLDTHVAHVSRGHAPLVFRDFGFFFNPFRPAYPAPYGDVRMSLPWLFIAWAVIVAVACWRGSTPVSRRLFLGLAAIVGAHIALIEWGRAWNVVPHVLYNIQFSWRLGAYVLLGTALLVMLALELHSVAGDTSRHRVASGVLVALLAFNVAAAVWQVWNVHSIYVHNGRAIPTDGDFDRLVAASRYDAPPSWRDVTSFRDATAPTVRHPAHRSLAIPFESVHGSSFSGTLAVPDGPEPFSTNISAGSNFIRMTGIRAVGRTDLGYVVAVRASGAPERGPVAITIGPARNGMVRAGAVVSAFSTIALLGVLAAPLLSVGRRRSARDRRPAEIRS